MNFPALIVFGQSIFIKLDGIHAVFMPVNIEFLGILYVYLSVKFEHIIFNS